MARRVNSPDQLLEFFALCPNHVDLKKITEEKLEKLMHGKTLSFQEKVELCKKLPATSMLRRHMTQLLAQHFSKNKDFKIGLSLLYVLDDNPASKPYQEVLTQLFESSKTASNWLELYGKVDAKNPLLGKIMSNALAASRKDGLKPEVWTEAVLTMDPESPKWARLFEASVSIIRDAESFDDMYSLLLAARKGSPSYTYALAELPNLMRTERHYMIVQELSEPPKTPAEVSSEKKDAALSISDQDLTRWTSAVDTKLPELPDTPIPVSPDMMIAEKVLDTLRTDPSLPDAIALGSSTDIPESEAPFHDELESALLNLMDESK
jgi:hypothetical protein